MFIVLYYDAKMYNSDSILLPHSKNVRQKLFNTEITSAVEVECFSQATSFCATHITKKYSMLSAINWLNILIVFSYKEKPKKKQCDKVYKETNMS